MRLDASERLATHAHAWIPLSSERIVSPAVFVHPGPPRASRGYGSGLQAVTTGMIVLGTASGEGLTKRLPVFRRPDNRLAGGPTSLCTVPRAGAATRPDHFVVACDGLDQVVEYHLDVSGHPTYAGSFTVGAGVTGVAYDPRDERVVSWSQIARQLTILVLRSTEVAPPLSWARAPALAHTIAAHGPRDAQLDRGRQVFHESSLRIARDGRSCVSCHPGGRQDGLVWSSPVGPRQTPMLAGRLAGTAPFGWNGEAEHLRDHVRETVGRLGGTGLPDDDLDAVVAYIAAMPGPTPTSVQGDRDTIARGREIFESGGTGCGSSHRSDGAYTHERNHVVLGGVETNAPSLRYVAGTAPYMHDGRHATLEAVLDGTEGLMGRTAHLSRDDRAALLAFLRTL